MVKTDIIILGLQSIFPGHDPGVAPLTLVRAVASLACRWFTMWIGWRRRGLRDKGYYLLLSSHALRSQTA